ncbi:MAG: tape measure protein [Homoserinimonas sp.]
MANGVELATAWIRLVPSMDGAQGAIAKGLGGSGITGVAEKAGGNMGDALINGVGKISKVGALAVGGALAAGIGTALVKGFARLNALDQATAKLTGLGHSAETVDKIMDNALASVKGTAFGMDEAASAAAGAVASGIKPGKDLERTLKAVADASTIAGVDMGSMGAIFNKVAASNKVQMDVINQLHDAGVPALALLADQMGVTAEEASKMASAGEIDFATFQAAMESGMGGAALESGNTFQGAMDNALASLGRVGANLLGGFFPDMTGGLKSLQDMLAPVEEWAKKVGAAFGDFVRDVGPQVVAVFDGIGKALSNTVSFVKDNIGWIGPLASAVLAAAVAFGVWQGAIALWQAAVKIATAVQVAFNLVMSANPIMLVVLAIAALVAAIVWVATQTTFFQDAWAAVSTFFVDTWTNIASFFTTIWENIVGFVSLYIAALRLVITTVVTAISDWWNSVWSGIGSFFSGIWEGIVGFATSYINTVRTVITAVIGAVKKTWENVWGGIADFFGGIWDGIVDVAKGAINGVIRMINNLVGGFNEVGNFLSDISGGAISFSIPRIPMLADGGTILRGGSVIVGERGPELLRLPAGATVDPDIRSAEADVRGSDEELVRTVVEALENMPEKFARKLKGYSRTDQRQGVA